MIISRIPGKRKGSGGPGFRVADAVRRFAAIASIVLLMSGCSAYGDDQVQKEKTAKQKAAREEKKTVEGNASPAGPVREIKQGEAQAVDPAGKEPLDDALTCLARTLYWEARSASQKEVEAIACVVMNRLGHEGFPSTVCGIVKQGSKHGSCQFSWWCDGKPITAKDQESYAKAKEVARQALNRELSDPTSGALYFHRKGTKPPWARKYILTATIGHNLFYKPDGGKAK